MVMTIAHVRCLSLSAMKATKRRTLSSWQQQRYVLQNHLLSFLMSPNYARKHSDTRTTSQEQGNRVTVVLSCTRLTYCLQSVQAQGMPSSTIKSINSLYLLLCALMPCSGSLTYMCFVVIFFFSFYLSPPCIVLDNQMFMVASPLGLMTMSIFNTHDIQKNKAIHTEHTLSPSVRSWWQQQLCIKTLRSYISSWN